MLFVSALLRAHTLQITTFKANVLDLLFTNERDLVSFIEYLPPLGKSHHCIINFTIGLDATREIGSKSTVTVQKKFSFKVYSSFWIEEARKAKVLEFRAFNGILFLKFCVY